VLLSLVDDLAGATIGATFNFYRDGAGASVRRERLRAYLWERQHASLMLVAEAPGYRGTRVSGIPLTSERQVSGAGPAEATATIVHRVLAELAIADETLLWNVVPTHPHVSGRPASNRRPTRAEIEASLPFLEPLRPGRRAVAVGRVAEAVLGAPAVRHPAHGGGAAFREELRTIVAHGASKGERWTRTSYASTPRRTAGRSWSGSTSGPPRI
jgi:uracil-DNA glycosylase